MLAWLCLLLFLPGCYLLPPLTTQGVASSVATSQTVNLVTHGGVTDSRGPTVRGLGRYYDFDDVLIPPGLSLNRDRTIAFRRGGRTVGMLVFDGRLEVQSLQNFFIAAMQNDGWSYESSFSHPQTALFFAKPRRTCVIHITEETLYTQVTVWVARAQP
ncbi:MAG: hypothetical protein KQJ78_04790 [Deltaproteobacteria bacterium]|nr:hypothetical protein [Deltaproteobacteria bacterium]